MKKLVRLICVVLLLFLLFYVTNFVNECRQMRDVFQTFVIVENPSSGKRCSVVNDTLKRNYDFLHFLDNPKPIWTDIGGHYVYSAFWKSEPNKKYAVGLGVGPSSDPNYDCSVWFDYENIVTSVKGRFSFIRSYTNTSLNIFTFVCDIEENKIRGLPYILVLTPANENSKKKSHIPIFYKTLPSTNETAICVKPDTVGIGKADIVEFISFHLLIGVTDLVLYGNEIHNSIIHRVRQLIGASSFLRSISILPWNFPYDDVLMESKLIEMDCEYRTFGLTKAFAILEWDQYIVSNTFKPILEIVQLDNNQMPYIINIRPQICCLESTDDKRSEISWPIILKKTFCTNYPFNTFFKIHGKEMIYDNNNNNAVVKDYYSNISMKTYRSCVGLKNIKIKYDHSPFKFLSGLLSSELLRLWNTGSMF